MIARRALLVFAALLSLFAPTLPVAAASPE